MMDVDVDSPLADSPCQSLPAEMIDSIIDHNYKDIAALKACSLVCKSWLVPSRFHIFSTVRLIAITDKNVSSFVALVTAPHSTFPAHFHTLVLKEKVGSIDPILPLAVSHIKIRCLIVSKNLPEKIWNKLSSQTLPDVVQINLSFNSIISRPSFQQAFALLSSFSELAKVHFSGQLQLEKKQCKDGVQQEEPRLNVTLPPKLNTVEIYLGTGLQVLLPAFANYNSLSRLHVYNISLKDSKTVQAYLGQATTTLRTLTYELGSFYDTPAVLNLSALQRLQVISLSVPLKDPLSWLGQTLQTITSPNIQVIKITIRSYTQLTRDDPFWEALDKLVCQFSNVMRLTITTSQHFAALANVKLSGCKSRGILGFKVWGVA